MNDLLNMANKVMTEFNPATDKVENFERVPDGDYNCLIEEVVYKQNEKGTKWVSMKCTIIDGEYENRLIFVNYFFSEKTMERSIKSLIKLAYLLGYQLPDNTFQDVPTIAEVFNQFAGNKILVNQKTSKNDYVNHSVDVLPF